jgi:hypothetical protein
LTEHQAYEVLEKYPVYELRRYPDHLVAEIEVGAFELAGNTAFPRLACYIGGHNRSSRRLAMTAPVVQEQDPHGRRYVVGFVMPADVSTEDLPDPVDSTVRTRRVPTETAAALGTPGAGRAAPLRSGLRNCSPPWTLPVWRWSATLGMRVSTHPGRRGSCEAMKSSSRWHPDPVGLQGSVEHDRAQPRSAAGEAASIGGRSCEPMPSHVAGRADGLVGHRLQNRAACSALICTMAAGTG